VHRLGGVELGVARTTAAPEDWRCRRAMVGRFPQRQGRRAEGAFGRQAADQPMRPAAAGAVVDLAIVIDGVIAAGIGIELPRAAGLNRTQHGAFLRNHLHAPTSVDSLGFKDDP